jgi:hypothetical protein
MHVRMTSHADTLLAAKNIMNISVRIKNTAYAPISVFTSLRSVCLSPCESLFYCHHAPDGVDNIIGYQQYPAFVYSNILFCSFAIEVFIVPLRFGAGSVDNAILMVWRA